MGELAPIIKAYAIFPRQIEKRLGFHGLVAGMRFEYLVSTAFEGAFPEKQMAQPIYALMKGER